MYHNIVKPYPAAPFISASVNTVHKDVLVLALLTAQITAMGIMKDFAGMIVLACTVTGVYTAAIVTDNSKKKYHINLHCIVTGLFIGFFLPNDIGFWFSFTIAFVSYFLSSGIFGGKGGTWINPAMLAVCIAAVSKPDCFADIITHQQIYEQGSVFNALSEVGFTNTAADRAITSMLNTSFLHKAGVTLPEGYITMLICFPSKIPAFRYNILTLIASILLLSLKTIQKILVFTFLAAYGILVYFFPITHEIAEFAQGDILYTWFTGGTLFSAFFIISYTGTLPRSSGGRLILGLAAAFFAFFIAKPATSLAAIPFAILSTNCLTPLIEQAEVLYYKKMRAS